VTQIGDGCGEVSRREFLVSLLGVPDFVDGFGEVLAKLRASAICLGPVIRQGQIQLQKLGGKGLDRDVLGRKDAIGGPDQKAEHERQQQGEQSGHSADHVAGTTGGKTFREVALKEKPNDAAGEDDERDEDSELFSVHCSPPDPDIGRLRIARLSASGRLPPSLTSVLVVTQPATLTGILEASRVVNEASPLPGPRPFDR
jgi:hypothetical protein